MKKFRGATDNTGATKSRGSYGKIRGATEIWEVGKILEAREIWELGKFREAREIPGS